MPPQLSAVVSGARLRPVSRRDALLCTIAAILGGVVYLNALRNPFVYDDYRTIVENGSIRTLSDLRAIVGHDVTRPIANFSFAIDRAIWGPTPFGFHLTSVLLHVLNVVLLFAIARRLAADRAGSGPSTAAAAPGYVAFLAAALFAVHPLMTEAVGYISGRSEVLCGTFFFLAFLCGRRWMRGGGWRWWVCTLALWGAGILTREVAAVLPLLLFCYDWVILDDDAKPARRHRWWVLHAPLMAVALVGAAIRIAVFVRVEHHGAIAIHWTAIFDQAIVVWQYVRFLVDPSGQSIYHAPRPVSTIWDVRGLLALGALAAAVAAAFLARRAARLPRFGIIWFVVVLVPSSLLALLGKGDAMAEHRAYLASCGLFLGAGAVVGWTLERLSTASRLTHGLAYATIVVGLLSLAGRTVIRNFVWGDPVALWLEATTLAPDDPLPHTVLAEELDQSGRVEEASVEYRTALRLKPEDPLAYLKLGVCLAVLHRFDEATETFERLRAIAPDSTVISTGLGAVALMSGRPEEARAEFMKTLTREPRDVMARQWLAILEEEAANDPAATLQRCEEIQAVTPNLSSTDDCIRRNRARLAKLAGARAPVR
jgi:protein O-mannosyl-transferase